MSRITVPSKLARSISSTPAVARPSRLLNGTTVSAEATGRKRQTKKDDPNLEDPSRLLTTDSTTHRPTANRAPRKVPMMQGFRTSVPARATPRLDASRVHSMVLPRLDDDSAAAADSYAQIRVPLVWDQARPAGLPRAAELPDGPVLQPEISIVAAAGPAAVLPSALTEVEGMGVDGVELKFVHELDGGVSARSSSGAEDGQGMIRDIWKGLMDDVFNSGRKAGGAAV